MKRFELTMWKDKSMIDEYVKVWISLRLRKKIGQIEKTIRGIDEKKMNLFDENC